MLKLFEIKKVAMTYSDTNAVPAAQCQRGGLTSHTNAQKKRALAFMLKLFAVKKVAMPTRESVGCDNGNFSFPKECL